MNNIALEINKISFSYNKQCVLNECSGKIEAGTITALLGSNGQGKTTLIKCLLGYLKISSGDIKIFDRNIKNYAIRELAKKISYVPQMNETLNDVIVRDYIVEGRTPYLGNFSMPRLDEYLLVEKYADMLGIVNLLSKSVNQLSGGQMQSVMIVRALTQETDIIIMDEPMAALDMSLQMGFLKMTENLKKLGKTIIFTTHNPEHALVLNCNTWVMKNGKIAYAGLANNILNEMVLKELYGPGIVLVDYKDRKLCSFELSE